MKVVSKSQYNLSRQCKQIDCVYKTFPKEKSVTTLDYEQPNSPLVFDNIISYTKNDKQYELQIDFYVKSITNYPHSMMTKSINEDECGKKLDYPQQVLKLSEPNTFYYK